MHSFKLSALDFIKKEAECLFALTQKVNISFDATCKLLLACQGRILIFSMGQSAHIAAKMAATFTSTGSPSLFVNPIDIYQGNTGLVGKNDVALFISNSGNTPELLDLLPLFRNQNIPLITLTENLNSPLASAATVALDINVEQDSQYSKRLGATTALVMGDALAIALLNARGFTPEDFSLFHPGGNLGKRLLLRVDDLCHRGNELPQVGEHATFSEALIEATHKKLGMTCITNEAGILLGIFTDGDVRRALQKGLDVHKTLISDMMTKNCLTIKMGMLAIEALKMMQEYKITCLIIINEIRQPIGVVSMYDLLKAGMV